MLMTAEFSTHLAFKFLPTLLLRIDPACYCALPSGTQHTAHHREESIRYFQCVLTAKTACQLIFLLSYLFLLRLSLLHNSFPYLSSLFLMQSREDINEKKGIRFTPLPKSCFPVFEHCSFVQIFLKEGRWSLRHRVRRGKWGCSFCRTMSTNPKTENVTKSSPMTMKEGKYFPLKKF